MGDFGSRSAAAVGARSGDRVARLVERFGESFGRPPELVASCPGVVSLLGGHAGMEGLPLLTLASDRQTLVAAAPRTDRRVMLGNTAGEYVDCNYQIQAGIRRFAAGHWGNYAKAAAQAAVSTLGPETLRGGELLVDGDVPPRVGLRSSTSLVTACLFALLAINDREAAAAALESMVGRAELYLGAPALWPDVVTCLAGEQGHALWVDPGARTHRPIALARDIAIVVSPLAGTDAGAARQLHEARLVECRLVCRVLDRALAGRLPRALTHFSDLRRFFPDRPLSDFATVLANILPPRPLCLGEIAQRIGTSEGSLCRAAGIARATGETYRLIERARHIVTEADRVEHAARLLARGESAAVAALLDSSHGSAREDYALVTPEAEALVAACRQCGAAGSRLAWAATGACVVSVVAASEVPYVLGMLERRRLASRDLPLRLAASFAVRAGGGAAVQRVQD